jgi:hypothetical protein
LLTSRSKPDGSQQDFRICQSIIPLSVDEKQPRLHEVAFMTDVILEIQDLHGETP